MTAATLPVRPGRIVHDQFGRFFLVLSASGQSLVVRELSRRVYGQTRTFADLALGHVGPHKSRFLPGSQPIRTRATLKAWNGGRLEAVWCPDVRPETCDPRHLAALSVPMDAKRCRLPWASGVTRPAPIAMVEPWEGMAA